MPRQGTESTLLNFHFHAGKGREGEEKGEIPSRRFSVPDRMPCGVEASYPLFSLLLSPPIVSTQQSKLNHAHPWPPESSCPVLRCSANNKNVAGRKSGPDPETRSRLTLILTHVLILLIHKLKFISVLLIFRLLGLTISWQVILYPLHRCNQGKNHFKFLA